MCLVKQLIWLLDGLRRFQLLYDLAPLNPKTTYFPGDDIFLVGENAIAVKKRQSERASNVTNFARSGDFPYQVQATCISSLPRWHFVRSLNSPGNNEREDEDVNGLWMAVDDIVSDTRKIIWELNPLVGRMVRREEQPHILRMRSWKAFLATTLYLGEKFRPLTSIPWRVILSGMDPADIQECEGEATCCADSGVEFQIHRMLTEAVDEEERRSSHVPARSNCVTFVITGKEKFYPTHHRKEERPKAPHST